ncbi:hypothetical protein VMCG_09181 [Cytospora schulzeri]|uniref:F-box domain-containing protein n=1 Tax=Cytospora schulzeri TaxID=448051 RepID=A0A423VLK5_9PEZI|nr:hypothetical protein VMCG_09181 [Valsa malicola]
MTSSTSMCLGSLPAEIKLHILKQLDGRGLHSMIQADSSCLHLWQQYPRQIFRAVFKNIYYKLHPRAQYNAYIAFRLREAKREHIEEMGNRREDDQDRDVLNETLRSILLDEEEEGEEEGKEQSSNADGQGGQMTEMIMDVDSLAAYSDLVSSVDSLVDRYANDAWRRVQHISLETGTSNPSPAGTIASNPKINLTSEERGRFQRAFVAAEIYLLTKFYTNGQGQRHRLTMGEVIHFYVPSRTHNPTQGERRQFDSCLRYIFHAYRAHLRRTARELGVPEFPTANEGTRTGLEEGEDEPPRKRQRLSASSASSIHHLREAKGTEISRLDEKTKKFAQRSISDEQKFLLWLCQFGIGPLEQTHTASAAVRRDEMLKQFSRTQLWDTTTLTLQRRSYTANPTRRALRQRHPVKDLYSCHGRLRYGTCGTPWACASAFLDWKWMDPDGTSRLRRRGDVVLNEHGRWITMADTDSGVEDWSPFESQDHVVPSEYLYVLDRNKYSFRSLPSRVFLLEP